MDRQREIELITELCDSGSYFAQYFRADKSTMISNLRSDFPIEMNCSWTLEAENAKAEAMKTILNLEMDHQEGIQSIRGANDREIVDLQEAILLTRDPTARETLVTMYGRVKIIRMERNLGFTATDQDLDYLLDLAEK